MEGVLWALASAYRPVENLQALKMCRANIEELILRQQGATVFNSYRVFDQRALDLAMERPVHRRDAATGRYVVRGADEIINDSAHAHLNRLESRSSAQER